MLIKFIPEWLSKLHFFFKRKDRATFFTKRSWAYKLANKHKGKREEQAHCPLHCQTKFNIKIISATKQNYKNVAVPQNSENWYLILCLDFLLQHREENIGQNTIRMQRSL